MYVYVMLVPSAVPLEAADLVAFSEAWKACDGKRELLVVSPQGLARYWPDVRSSRRFTDVDLKKTAIGAGQVVSRKQPSRKKHGTPRL